MNRVVCSAARRGGRTRRSARRGFAPKLLPGRDLQPVRLRRVREVMPRVVGRACLSGSRSDRRVRGPNAAFPRSAFAPPTPATSCAFGTPRTSCRGHPPTSRAWGLLCA